VFHFSYVIEIHMIQRELIAKTLPPDFVHVVTGTWATKTIHSNGELVTVAMIRARVLEEEEAMTDAETTMAVPGVLISMRMLRRSTEAGPLTALRCYPLPGFFGLARDLRQGGAEFAEDFQSGMQEMGFERLS
jgi:hypothetical protein